MIGEFIADASLAISWVVRGQSTAVADQLALEIETGTEFHVPQVWFFEVSNVLVVLRRRETITDEEYESGRSTLGVAHPIVDSAGPALALSRTADIAMRLGLTVYDATYLELAQRLHLALASRDGRLLAAASTLGVDAIDAR